MIRQLAPVFALLVAAAPAAASAQQCPPWGTQGTLQFYEASLGSPGVTAPFPSGTGLLADIDFDASSAEGGGMFGGASEIEIRPTGAAEFLGFDCQLTGCSPDDYNFTPGGAAEGALIFVIDSDSRDKQGTYDLGSITFDAPDGVGSIELVGCGYTSFTGCEYRCRPFTLVALPEAGASALLAGAALLFALRRRHI